MTLTTRAEDALGRLPSPIAGYSVNLVNSECMVFPSTRCTVLATANHGGSLSRTVAKNETLTFFHLNTTSEPLGYRDILRIE